MKLYKLTLFLSVIFCLSCAEQKEYTEDFATVYASTVKVEGRFLQCNVFSDNTFQGRIQVSKDDENCLDMKIIKSPKNIFSTENTFVQIYPFNIIKDKLIFGDSLNILAYQKEETVGDSSSIFKTKIIDSYLIKNQMKTSTKSFFKKHHLRLCNLKDWDALQIVLYLRKEEYDEPQAARVTRLLIPPFLSNPNHFREDDGESLLTYHPFFKFLKEDLELEPSSYYEISKSKCYSKN
ncbi:MAG: hypothetical protein ACR2M7_00820 [Bdellovibrionales bacterium]